MSGSLPPFPVDDATLLAVEHALGGAYTIEEGEHVLVGAEYSLSDLLDMLGGAFDPPDLDADQNPALMPDGEIGGTPVYYDVRVHYSDRDLIRALVAEVKRLRDLVPVDAREPRSVA